MERFMNPFIRHELMSIALNSTTKFRTRLLTTYNDYRNIYGKSPKHILFALAALIVFYRGKRGDEQIKLADDQKYLDFWRELWQLDDCAEIAKKALSAEDIWQQSLDTDNNAELVAGYIKSMTENGMRAALKAFLAEE
jgi:tagaturonate reductase